MMKLNRRKETLPLPPKPYVVSDSGRFDGNDGKWSTFFINIGDDGTGQGQNFRVLISTSSPVTIVPGVTEWCDSNCARTRGVEIYNGEQPRGIEESAQWELVGVYQMPQPHWWTESYRIDQSNTTGVWGVDNVGLGTTSTQSPILAEQYAVKTLVQDYFMGSFGLAAGETGPSGGSKPNFIDNFYGPPSHQIASKSYGYTAGAHYRNNGRGVVGSLVLGGFDNSRLKTEGISIRMPNDRNNTLIVGVMSIVSETDPEVESNAHSLTPAGGFSATIDSATPYLILPDEVCEEFVIAFGLAFDEGSQLYLVNSSSHKENERKNANISFKIGAGPADSDMFTEIVLPYSAFDQQASFPLNVSEDNTQYFPIKRSDNGIYVLGRTFLQESYIIVDYERTNFTVAPVVYADPMPSQSLVPIFNESYTGLPSVPDGDEDSGGKIPTGAIAGIVVGIVVAFVLVAVGVFFWWRKRRNEKKKAPEDDKPSEIDTTHAGTEVKRRRISELTGSEAPQSPKGSTMGYYNSDHKWVAPVSEMSPDSTPAELYSPPPESHDGYDYFAAGGMRRHRGSSGNNTPRTPIAELPGEDAIHEVHGQGVDKMNPIQKPQHNRSPSDSSLGTKIDTVLANDRTTEAGAVANANSTTVGSASPTTADAPVSTGEEPAEHSAMERRPSHTRGLSDTTIQSDSTAVSQPTPEELANWQRSEQDGSNRPLSP